MHALHSAATARNFFIVLISPQLHSSSFFPNPLPTFGLYYLANATSCVSPQKKIGLDPCLCHMLSACRIYISSKTCEIVHCSSQTYLCDLFFSFSALLNSDSAYCLGVPLLKMWYLCRLLCFSAFSVLSCWSMGGNDHFWILNQHGEIMLERCI